MLTVQYECKLSQVMEVQRCKLSKVMQDQTYARSASDASDARSKISK